MRKPRIYAHRGYSRIAPENTMAAFEKAAAAGADGIELDVQLTRDEMIVVIHDYELGRTCDGSGMVREHDLEQLRELDFGSWFSEEYAGERIPELSQVLEFISGRELLLNIELKTLPGSDTSTLEKKLLDELSDKGSMDRLLISSFDHHILDRLKKENSSIKTAPLYVGAFVDIGKYAKGLAATAVHPAFGSLDDTSVSKIHGYGVEVNTWTVDKITDFEAAVGFGVDGIITNDPGLLCRV